MCFNYDGDVDGVAQLEGGDENKQTNKHKIRNAFQSKGSSAVLSWRAATIKSRLFDSFLSSASYSQILTKIG